MVVTMRFTAVLSIITCFTMCCINIPNILTFKVKFYNHNFLEMIRWNYRMINKFPEWYAFRQVITTKLHDNQVCNSLTPNAFFTSNLQVLWPFQKATFMIRVRILLCDRPQLVVVLEPRFSKVLILELQQDLWTGTLSCKSRTLWAVILRPFFLDGLATPTGQVCIMQVSKAGWPAIEVFYGRKSISKIPPVSQKIVIKDFPSRVSMRVQTGLVQPGCFHWALCCWDSTCYYSSQKVLLRFLEEL